MVAFYSSLALLCLNLGPSVLGHPTKRAPGDAWDVLYNGHNAFLSEIERDHPGSLKDLATSGQRMSLSLDQQHIVLILCRSQLHGFSLFRQSVSRAIITFTKTYSFLPQSCTGNDLQHSTWDDFL